MSVVEVNTNKGIDFVCWRCRQNLEYGNFFDVLFAEDDKEIAIIKE